METWFEFNGVRILLTTGQTLEEIQAADKIETADLILSIYPWGRNIGPKVLKGQIQC
jgi:hypothetical protein